MTLIIPILTLFFLAGCGCSPLADPALAKQSLEVAKTTSIGFLPQTRDGYWVEKWAEVPGARSLAVSPDGQTVFVGSRSGWVHKVSVTDRGPKVELFQEGLEGSNGVCFLGEDLLIAERLQVKRYSADKGFDSQQTGSLILNGFPDEKHHGWRYMKVSPEGRIYLAIGAPCNVCERKDDPRFASIVSFEEDGSALRLEAEGVRNSVGFDWHPQSRDFYFTDNGRDNLGDDVPPCELNVLPHGDSGKHYGFPYFYGDDQPDPEYGSRAPDKTFVSPLVKFQAHVAPLGCYFPRSESLRSQFNNQILVAQHGSWNRSSKVGYQVVGLDLNQKAPKPDPLLWGFLEGEKTLGRPVDIAELPDGTLLVSDDGGGVIWAVRAR